MYVCSLRAKTVLIDNLTIYYWIVNASFPSSTNGKVIFNVFLHYLCNCHLEVLMGNMDASLSQGKHSCFGTYCFCFCS